MKKKMIELLGIAMIIGCMSACGSTAVAPSADVALAPSTDAAAVSTESTEKVNGSKDAASGYVVYDFETYDGENVVIDASNIISQESVEDALENAPVPADAEPIAPGRDYEYYEDATHYYVVDAYNNLYTVANKNVEADSKDTVATGNKVYEADEYSISYSEKDFELIEARGAVTLNYCNKDINFAGSNQISITKDEGAKAEDIAKAIAGEGNQDKISDGSLGSDVIPVKVYSRTCESPADSNLTLVDSFMVMQSGDDVITIEVINTVGQEDEIDMPIQGAFTTTLESFVLK